MIVLAIHSGVGIAACSGFSSRVSSGVGSVQCVGDGWLGSGSEVGQIVKRWSVVHQNPLHKCGEIPPRTIHGQACLGLLTEAGVEKYAK